MNAVARMEGSSYKPSAAQCGVVFCFFAIVYGYTTYPSVPGGDSGELLASACELGVAHPPGYPLWTLLSAVVINVLPFGSPAWRVNLLNSFTSAAANSILYAACVRLTGFSIGSLAATILFGLSPLVWSWSVSAEVFTLNNLFVALLIWLMVKFETSVSSQQRAHIARTGCFIAGLSLCNQHTIVLFLHFFACRVIYKLYRLEELSYLCVLLCLGSGLAGLAPYLYLPVSSYLNVARWSWGDHTSINGFLKHILRVEYGSFDLGKDSSGKGFLANLVMYKTSALEELSYPGYALGCIGIVQTFTDRMEALRRSAQTFLYMLIFYVGFFCWRANLDTSNPLLREVVERFWLQPHMVWSILIAMGFKLFHVRFSGLMKAHSLVKGSLVAVLVAICLARSWNLCDHHDDHVISNFAEAIMKAFPNNSLVLTKGDLPSGSFRYKQYCEGLRPDLDLLDQELMSYDWFLPKMRGKLARVDFPGDQWYTKTGITSDGLHTFDFNTFLARNYKRRPIFVCIGMQERDDSWATQFHLMPYGPCHQLVQNLSDWAESELPYKDTWSHQYSSYRVGSWENVADEEMWNAKIAKVMFLWSQAEQTANMDERKHLHTLAYQIYKNIFQTHSAVPDYMHKNFALSCERMARFSTSSSKYVLQYLSESIKHFEYFVNSGASDDQMEQIRSILQSLKQQRKQLEQLTTTH